MPKSDNEDDSDLALVPPLYVNFELNISRDNINRIPSRY